MPIEKIGYRRLYDALGCSIQGSNEICISSLIANIQTEVYLGPRPRFGIFYIKEETSKYVVPHEPSMVVMMDYKKDATKSTYPRNFFLEISCIKEVEVSQELSIKFHAKDTSARDTLLKMASEYHEIYNQVADVVAGTVGLRFHRQFVLELINHNYFAILNQMEEEINFSTSSLEILEDVALKPHGTDILNQTLQSLNRATVKSISFGAKALGWLMRGWVERDAITKFMDFFITLEIILDEISDSELKTHQQKIADQIFEIINLYGGENKSEQESLFKSMLEKQKPSLNSRFTLLARESQFEGWESDIVAFKRFNKIRNNLLHHGEKKVEMIVTVGDEEIRQIEDLAERYISKVLFKDGIVYQSRWRSHKKAK